MIRLVNPLETPEWDRALADRIDATIFHTTAWARVLTSTYGYNPCYLCHEREGRLGSLLPLMETESWITGRRAISLPFTDECPPLLSDPSAAPELASELREQARVRRWRSLELRGGQVLFPSAQPAVSFLGHRLELTSGAAALFGKMAGHVRQAVRKAERLGVTVEFSDSESSVSEFYRLLCRTRQRHGLPPQPYEFFLNIQRYILAAKNGVVALARERGEAIAGAVYFHFRDQVLYKFGASRSDRQQLRPNNLVMWRAIEKFCEQRFTVLDFGRTSADNDGLRRFKLGWGATERTIPYQAYDTVSDRFVTKPDRSSGWHTQVIRHLPIPISRLIGATMYKHVA